MVLHMRWLLLAVLVSGCAAPELSDTDVRYAERQALVHWDERVGHRIEFPIRYDRSEDVSNVGVCNSVDGAVEITIYLNAFRTYDNPLAKLRGTILHELAHAHLTCSDDDHVSDLHSLMYYKATESSYDWLDDDTVARLQAIP
jgi:hypothetical protein